MKRLTAHSLVAAIFLAARIPVRAQAQALTLGAGLLTGQVLDHSTQAPVPSAAACHAGHGSQAARARDFWCPGYGSVAVAGPGWSGAGSRLWDAAPPAHCLVSLYKHKIAK
ncbi:hypothetical protein GCM10022409_16310 [Hymenobacter glaciei]|uniref:Uncharacterized protein n=1 Tax=Hymenobacter glaciei TaxID=877209 RepID=A0ABP7TY04_9BACT